ncbi:unnamed protein product [Acanthoscelides obtectus]|uniref:Uncharacterized protein n=1 Tax=Acanthoscelides obtectus TaxID=200917 RepID=A0A9P0Q517_ACAOB|nr:unnamed protein product [Acanthoscelides obtectus]CAK1658358.1 hypothetical protein AOBTE_LOCUS20843 [Acanthoscelides obtectus]
MMFHFWSQLVNHSVCLHHFVILFLSICYLIIFKFLIFCSTWFKLTQSGYIFSRLQTVVLSISHRKSL